MIAQSLGTPLRNCYRLAWEWLQIDTDLLLIITSTADELSRGTNIGDFERSWTPKIRGFSDFFSRYQAVTHILRVNCARITGVRARQPACEIFSIRRRFQQSSFVPLFPIRRRQIWAPPSKRAVSATTAVARLISISSDFLLSLSL